MMERSKLLNKDEMTKWIEDSKLPLLLEVTQLSEDIIILKRITQRKW